MSSASDDSAKELKSQNAPGAPENPLLGRNDNLPKDYQRASHELLYESMMRGGGEPFGQPLGIGVTTLTFRTVRRFRKRGFFFFSTYEKFTARQRNPFSRAGAATNQKEYTEEQIRAALNPSQRKPKSLLRRFFDVLLWRDLDEGRRW